MEKKENIEAIKIPEGFDSLPKPFQDFIYQLIKKLEKLETENALLKAENEELKIRLSQNSSNSGKPPSSDGLNKKNTTTSLREKSGKKPGGQLGHEGNTLKQVEIPDHTIIHQHDACAHCGTNLQNVQMDIGSEKRQVFEIPEPKFIVTEHKVVNKTCPSCKKVSTGKFPDSISAPVQYGL